MKKNPAAVALGRKGGKARAANLDKQALRRIGQKGARARWKNGTKGLTTA